MLYYYHKYIFLLFAQRIKSFLDQVLKKYVYLLKQKKNINVRAIIPGGV